MTLWFASVNGESAWNSFVGSLQVWKSSTLLFSVSQVIILLAFFHIWFLTSKSLFSALLHWNCQSGPFWNKVPVSSTAAHMEDVSWKSACKRTSRDFVRRRWCAHACSKSRGYYSYPLLPFLRSPLPLRDHLFHSGEPGEDSWNLHAMGFPVPVRKRGPELTSGLAEVLSASNHLDWQSRCSPSCPARSSLSKLELCF